MSMCWLHWLYCRVVTVAVLWCGSRVMPAMVVVAVNLCCVGSWAVLAVWV